MAMKYFFILAIIGLITVLFLSGFMFRLLKVKLNSIRGR